MIGKPQPMAESELMKTVFDLAGAGAVAAGLLFLGQGLGYIRWPANSFMINDVRWAYYGAAIAIAGIILIITAGRRTKRR